MNADQRKFLLGLAARNGGKLTAAETLEAARDPNSPIHCEFEWNDALASEKFRLGQARELIRSVKIETWFNRGEVKTISVQQLSTEEMAEFRKKTALPVFVRDPELAPDVQGYIMTEVAASHEQTARAVIRAEISRVMSCLQRAQAFADYFDMASEVEYIAARAKALADRIDSAEYKKPDQDCDEAA